MADKKQPETSAHAFDVFAQKLTRFIAATDEGDISLQRSDERYRQLLQEREQQLKKTVITTYKKFLSPYEVFGKESRQAAEIVKDETELLTAYHLFSEIQEVNERRATKDTFLVTPVIETPLAERDRYTVGGEFLYLQCWLFYQNGCTAYIPTLKTEVAAADKRRAMHFVPAARYRQSHQEKEIISIIKNCFYPGT
ncbi:MAG: hypothetical protein IJ191_00960 [Treponema sp.]|nr:hypothetical protein [Treponema sp.]